MNINLKTGIEKLKFGLTESQIEKLLGKPDRIIIDQDDDNQIIYQYNFLKALITFYKEEGGKLGYIRSSNPELKFDDKYIIDKDINDVKNEVFKISDSDWEIEDYDFFETHFFETQTMYLTLNSKYGKVVSIELGVPFKNENEYNWP